MTSTAICPDGRMLLTGSSDQTARLWDMKSCLPAGKMMWHDLSVNAVQFGPTGDWVVPGSGEFDWSSPAQFDRDKERVRETAD